MTVRPIRSNPKAKPAAVDHWITRNIRVLVKTDTSGVGSIAGSQVALALGLVGTETCFLKVISMKLWNMTNGSTSSNYIKVTTDSYVTDDDSYRVAEDIGTASHLAGVSINIPDTLAQRNAVANTTTSLFCTISTAPAAGIGGSNVVCADLLCKYQV